MDRYPINPNWNNRPMVTTGTATVTAELSLLLPGADVLRRRN